MATTLGRLAELVGGQVLGPETIRVSGAAALDGAQSGDITLIDSKDKIGRLSSSPAAAAVVPLGVVPADKPAILVKSVHQAFATIVAHFRPPRIHPRLGVSPAAIISPTAKLGGDVDVHAYATIGDDVEIGRGSTIHAGVHVMAGCKLGPGATLMPGVVVYENTVIGARVTIHAGAVIGAHGFGYHLVDGRHQPGAQLGYVEIGDDVEIGAGSTIDRGTYGTTSIGEGTKIDNLVMIAHNCRIGRHNLICSQVGIAGSTSTGDYVVMAGQVGIRDHVHIGSRAVLAAKAGVSNDVPEGAQMMGIPATPQRDQKLKQAALSRLPEMRKELKVIQRTLDELVRDRDTDEPSRAA